MHLECFSTSRRVLVILAVAFELKETTGNLAATFRFPEIMIGLHKGRKHKSTRDERFVLVR